MSSKTKIVVLRVKELIDTSIFVVLGILFLVLLIVMFLPDKNENQETMAPGVTEETVKYVPGVYTTSLILNGNVVEIEVTVDEYNINSVRLKNLDDAVTAMYPLLEPAFDNLATQIVENQSLSNLTFPEENQYTSMVLEEAIYNTFEKAKAEDNTTK